LLQYAFHSVKEYVMLNVVDIILQVRERRVNKYYDVNVFI